MTRVIANEPVLDFFQDVFETPELSINILFVDVRCDSRHVRRGRWSIISNGATRPPVTTGKVTTTNISKKRRNHHGKKEQ